MNPSDIRREVARQALHLVTQLQDLPSAPPLERGFARLELETTLDLIRDLVRAQIDDAFQEAPSCRKQP